MKFEYRLRALKLEVIKKYFPELGKKKILLAVLPLGCYWGASIWPLPFVRLIIISPKSRFLPAPALIALMAHEISHHTLYLKRGSWWRYIIYTPLLYLKKGSIKKEEHLVDKQLMDRGLGYNLFLLTKIIDEDPDHEMVKNHYYSPEEIEGYCLEREKSFKAQNPGILSKQEKKNLRQDYVKNLYHRARSLGQPFEK